MITIIGSNGFNDYDYDSIPKLMYASDPPSGRENRRERRKEELRKRKGRL